MKKNRTIKLLEFLTAKEAKEFEQLVRQNKYSNSNIHGRIIDLFKVLSRNRKLPQSNEDVMLYISKELNLKKTSVQNRLSELNNFIEIFAATKRIEKNKIIRDRILLEVFKESDNTKLFDHKFKTLTGNIENNRITPLGLINLAMLYEQSLSRHLKAGETEAYLRDYEISNFYRISAFVVFLISRFIDYIMLKEFDIESSSIIVKVLSWFDIESIINEVKAVDQKQYLCLTVYYYMYKAFLSQQDESVFINALNIHREHFDMLDPEVNQFLYTAQVNYCINKTNRGQHNYFRIVFEIVKDKVAKGYISELKQINLETSQFRDYVIFALRQNEIDWASYFVSNYSKYLPEKIRVDSENLARGGIANAEGKYYEAIGYLDKVSRNNYFSYTDAGFVKIMALYRLGRLDEVFEENERIKTYIAYHKEIPSIQMNLIRGRSSDISALLKLKHGLTSKSDSEMYLKTIKPRVLARWLREEFEKLGVKQTKSYLNRKAAPLPADLSGLRQKAGLLIPLSKSAGRKSSEGEGSDV